VPSDALILEIGGGYNPRYEKSTHPNAYHLDHASRQELRDKFAAFADMRLSIDRIQAIDFVSDGGPIDELVPADLRFDLIYGSHVLEHQVDLIGHLQSLEKLLKPEGRVIEMIPDLRACSDALRFPTVTSDTLLVHGRSGLRHRGKQRFDGLAHHLKAYPGYRMRDAHSEGIDFAYDIREAYQAMLTAEDAGTGYVDTHAWTFTPESFRLLMIELRLLGLTRLVPTYVSPPYRNQFCVVLERARGPDDALVPSVRQALERKRLFLSRALSVR
jgi:SAM-dependent methyltransferase